MLNTIISPINFSILCICTFLVYIICRYFLWPKKPLNPPIPKMGKQDFTLEELQHFNGDGPDKRILVSVNGAPYAILAGKDASRALACFSTDKSSLKNDYDDLSDISPEQMSSLLEWELQFSERYDYIGRLLKPGESHHVYEQDDPVVQINQETSKFENQLKEKAN